MSDEKINMSVFDKIIGVINDHNQKEKQLYEYFNEIGTKLSALTDSVKGIAEVSNDDKIDDAQESRKNQNTRIIATKSDAQVRTNTKLPTSVNTPMLKKPSMDDPLKVIAADDKFDISQLHEFMGDINTTDGLLKTINDRFSLFSKLTKETTDLQKIVIKNHKNGLKSGDAISFFGHRSAKNDKGFMASVRRGVVDPDNDLGKEKGFFGKIGRGLGNMIASDGLSMSERRGYGRATYQAEEADTRLATGDITKPLAHEQRQLDELRNNVKQGNVNIGNMTEDAYMEKAQKDLLTRNNEHARIRSGLSPKAKVFSDVSETPEEPATVTDLVKNKYIPKKKQEVTPGQYTSNDTTPTKKPHIITPTSKTGTMNVSTLNVGAMNIAEAEPVEQKKTAFKFEKPNVTKWGEIGKAGTQQVTSVADKINLSNLTIAKLTVETLIANKTESNPDGSQPQAVDGDSGIGLPDITLGRGGKAMGMLGKGARLLGKAALPLAAGMAVVDGVSGYNNANENLGIQGREATFGEKMSSAVGSVASGLSFGLIDAKTASGAIKSFTGAGPDANAKVNPLPEKEYGNLVKPNEIEPVVSQQHAELGLASDENYSLKEQERAAFAQNQGNISINAPTNISSKSGGGVSMPSVIRPSNTAYERFVDRVFTTL